MSEDTLVVSLLIEQRGRLVASIMGHAERNLFADLSEAQKRAFRQKVLESVGVFYDFVRDLTRANAAVNQAEGVVVNEDAMRMLGEIHGLLTKRGD